MPDEATNLIKDKHLARIIQCAVKRRCVSYRCKSCLGSCRDTPVATKAIRRVTDWSKLLGQRPTSGGSASRRAATRVKPEQASNVKSRGPTGLNNREGRGSPCEHPTDDHGFARRGKGRGTSASHTGQHGRSHAARRAPRSIIRVEPRGKSEGLIVPMALGGQHNHRGGKAPWFEACLNESRSRRLARACSLLACPGDSKRRWASRPNRRGVRLCMPWCDTRPRAGCGKTARPVR